MPGRSLILYLLILNKLIGCVLGQHDKLGNKEHAIYYLSKKFTKYENNYSFVEKLCCALAWIARRLRQYMLYHTTWLITRLDPIKYLREAPALSDRLTRWQVMLSKYDILYGNQKAIKGSAIVNFLASWVTNDCQHLNFDFPDEDLMCISEAENIVKCGL